MATTASVTQDEVAQILLAALAGQPVRLSKKAAAQIHQFVYDWVNGAGAGPDFLGAGGEAKAYQSQPPAQTDWGSLVHTFLVETGYKKQFDQLQTNAVASGNATLGTKGGDDWVNKLIKQLGSDSGDAQAKRRARRNAQADFTMLLQNYGIPMTDSLSNLVQRAAHLGWNTSKFLLQLEHTAEFHQQFPGIFNGDGTLKMSPSQYISQKKAYQDYGARYGVDVGPKQLTWLFNNNVSSAEAAVRFQGIGKLEQNAQLFKQFNKQLEAMGEAPMTREDQFKFIMGIGNERYERLWDRAQVGYAAQQSGINLDANAKQAAKSYTSIAGGEQLIKSLAGKGLSEGQLQQGFAKLAQDLQTTFPQSRIQGFGLSKRDLAQLEFGGPRQAAIAQKAQQIMNNAKQFGAQITESADVGQGARQEQRIGARSGGSLS